MLETLYLRATSEELERVMPRLEDQLRSQLKNVTVQSITVDSDPQEDFEIPQESPDGEWLPSNCQVRIELSPADDGQLSEDEMDRLGEQLMKIFHEALGAHPSIPYFSFLDGE